MNCCWAPRAIQVLKLARARLAVRSPCILSGVHRPAGSHPHQQHSTNYDLDGSKSDSTSAVLVLSNLCKRLADLYRGISSFFLEGQPTRKIKLGYTSHPYNL